MEMFYLDIPYIHIGSNIKGVRFIKALNSTNEVEMFLLPSVQAIINYHWSSTTVLFYMWACLIIPYLA